MDLLSKLLKPLTIYPQNFHNPWRDNWVRQILPNETLVKLHSQTTTNKPVRCEVRKIVSNCKSVFEDHILGEKHRKNTLLHNNPSIAILSQTSNVRQELFVDEGKDIESEVELTSGNGIAPKRIKVAQPERCEICMIHCNSKDVYITHLSGKKHLRNLEKLSKSKSDGISAIVDATVAGASLVITTANAIQQETNKEVEPEEKQDTSKLEGNNSRQLENAVMLEAPEKDIETRKRKCELEGGAGASVAGVTAAIVTENYMQLGMNAAIEPQARLDTSKQEINSKLKNAVMSEAPKKDIETRKQKRELEVAAATVSSKFCHLSNINSRTVFNLPDFPVQCEICLIGCNTEHAYIRHLSGKKHLRNLAKLSKSKNDGAAAAVDGDTTVIITANDMQLEKSDISQQEWINSHRTKNVAVLESPREDIEIKRQKRELEGRVETISSCDKFDVNSKEVLSVPDGPARCEICLINCNSKHAYVSHLTGRKHLRNLEKLSTLKNDEVGAVAAIKEAMNRSIEHKGKLDTSRQEGIGLDKPENVVMLESSEKDVEAKKHKYEIFGGATTTFFKMCNL